jgi:acyl-CoA thioesterase I
MKPFALFILCVMFVRGASLALAADPAPVGGNSLSSFFRNLASKKKQSVVVYGTSLTEHGAWAQALEEWFDAEYPGLVRFTNSGGSGKNSKWGVAHLEKLVLSHRPDLVFLEFSYNDAVQESDLSLERCKSNLHRMVTGIRQQNPETIIVLQVMNPPWDAPNGKLAASKRPDVNGYNDIYRAYAREFGLALIDHYPSWEALRSGDPERFHQSIPDGSHPSSEASLAVTWPKIRSLMETAIKDAGLRSHAF